MNLDVPAMFLLEIDRCHEAECRVDDQDEEVHQCFERAVDAQGDTGPRDSDIPQILEHVLIETVHTNVLSAHTRRLDKYGPPYKSTLLRKT